MKKKKKEKKKRRFNQQNWDRIMKRCNSLVYGENWFPEKRVKSLVAQILSDHTKSVYGAGWLNVRDIEDEIYKKDKSLNIPSPKLIKILKSDAKFEYRTNNGTEFKLRNHQELQHFRKGADILGAVSIEHRDVEDNSDEFKREYEKLQTEYFPLSEDEVSIGLDFGTSYTKAAYNYSLNDRNLIPFGNLNMKASVVYTDSSFTKLSMFESAETEFQIRYFKAVMIPSADNSFAILADKRVVDEDFFYICSIFFVANILRYLKLKLAKHFGFSCAMQVNMGMPTLYDCKVASLYRKTLHVACALAESGKNLQQMDIKEIRKFSLEAEKNFVEDDYLPGIGYHVVYPELFAEALYILRRNNYGPGNYCIIDVGGGTADFMFLEKRKVKDALQFYSCHYASVTSLGNEIRKATEKKSYDASFTSCYRKMLLDSKKSLKSFGIKMTNVDAIIFGGGKFSDNNYYENLLSQGQLDQNEYGFSVHFVDDKNSDMDFMDNAQASDKRFFYSDRFIIAYQLALSAGMGNEKLEMLKIIPKTADDQSMKQQLLEEYKIQAGYEDIN